MLSEQSASRYESDPWPPCEDAWSREPKGRIAFSTPSCRAPLPPSCPEAWGLRRARPGDPSPLLPLTHWRLLSRGSSRGIQQSKAWYHDQCFCSLPRCSIATTEYCPVNTSHQSSYHTAHTISSRCCVICDEASTGIFDSSLGDRLAPIRAGWDVTIFASCFTLLRKYLDSSREFFRHPSYPSRSKEADLLTCICTTH